MCRLVVKPDFAAEAIFGGSMLALANKEFTVFYDWDTGRPVKKIDDAVTNVFWSDDGTCCCCLP